MRTCMNILCGTTSSVEWKTGWSLRPNQFAILCDKCGYAFEQRMYCEEFHTDDSGWRNCVSCGKRLHCGCIASIALIELLDKGGVKCVSCATNPFPNLGWNGGKNNEYGLCTVTQNNQSVDNHKDSNGISQLSMVHNQKTSATLGTLNQHGPIFPTEVVVTKSPPPPGVDKAVISPPWRAGGPGSTWASTLSHTSMGSFLKGRLDFSSSNMQTKNDYESVAHPNLNMSLGDRSGNLHFTPGPIIDKREQKKMSTAFNQGFGSPSLVQSSSPQLPFSPPPNSNMSTTPKPRGRPPIEGRARNQMLPRYWPRITDEELKQICGDSNCTIMPLFEKILSASDAGRIGRLVLPKACAEAYFPPISQAEGLPMKIQDVKGREWVFQFRFWPNNNSRMYVLEGVTPCIQSLELQAGDTVIFSRKDPEGKLILGFRKASNSSVQDQSVTNGGSGLPQSVKGSTSTHINDLSKQLNSAGGNINLHNSDKSNEVTEEGLLPSSMIKERKKGQNIGAKNRRLIIDNQDAQELKLTWEEVQGLLRPPPNAKPAITVIDGFEIEAYEEPPVIGKSSVFAAHSSGLIDQWVQCDSCSNWRRVPAEYLIPPKWTCADNTWDSARCSCSAPDELSPGELEKFSNLRKDFKKKKKAIVNGVTQEQESTGLSALANAAVQGDNRNEAGTSAAATTKKHPRHRDGCTCIVCIQPPSGKGKHKSTCTCAVCITVKRRFKTLMMRKKKRQTDQETGLGLKKRRKKNLDKEADKDNVENSHSLLENDSLQTELAQTDDGEDQNSIDDGGSSLDLNCHPSREEDSKSKNDQASLTNILKVPLESYMKQMSLNSPASEEQASSERHTGEVSGEIEGQHVEENPVSEAPQEQVNPSEGIGEHENENADKDQSDP